MSGGIKGQILSCLLIISKVLLTFTTCFAHLCYVTSIQSIPSSTESEPHNSRALTEMIRKVNKGEIFAQEIHNSCLLGKLENYCLLYRVYFLFYKQISLLTDGEYIRYGLIFSARQEAKVFLNSIFQHFQVFCQISIELEIEFNQRIKKLFSV